MNTGSFYQGLLFELTKTSASTQVQAAQPGAKPQMPPASAAATPTPVNVPPVKAAPAPQPTVQPQAQQDSWLAPTPAPVAEHKPYLQNTDGTPIDNPRGFFRSRANLPQQTWWADGDEIGGKPIVNTGYAKDLDEDNRIGKLGLGGKARSNFQPVIDAALKTYAETGQVGIDTNSPQIAEIAKQYGKTPEELINSVRYSDWAKKHILDQTQQIAHQKLTDPKANIFNLSAQQPDPKSTAGQIYSDMMLDPARRESLNKDLAAKTYGTASFNDRGGTQLSMQNFNWKNFLGDHWGKILMALLGVGALGWLGSNSGGQGTTVNNYISPRPMQ